MSHRLDLYCEIHKGLRLKLCTLLTQAGQLDPTSNDALDTFIDDLDTFVSLLEEHATHEDTWVQKLVSDLEPKLFDQIRDDHHVLNDLTTQLVPTFKKVRDAEMGDRVWRARDAYYHFAKFAGQYLSHMSVEETMVMPVLQGAMSDEELLDVQINLRGAVAPERLAMFLELMIPAMNLPERVSMLAGMKAGAPPEVFEGVCALSQNVLPQDDFEATRAQVGF